MFEPGTYEFDIYRAGFRAGMMKAMAAANGVEFAEIKPSEVKIEPSDLAGIPVVIAD